jgi:hypothetical protein
MLPSWLTPARELAVLRAWLWLAVAVNVASSCLYLFVPAGTVAYFGGAPTPTATFWCTTAAMGDAVSALWCYTALRANTACALRDAARGLLLFALVHMGAFVRGNYLIEPLTGGASYVVALLAGVALGSWFGFYRPVQVPDAARGGGRHESDAQQLRRTPRTSALPARRVASARAGTG